MGTIASVLQWTCGRCNLINPTECLQCYQCGNRRRLLVPPSSNLAQQPEQPVADNNGLSDRPPASDIGSAEVKSSDASAQRQLINNPAAKSVLYRTLPAAATTPAVATATTYTTTTNNNTSSNSSG